MWRKMWFSSEENTIRGSFIQLIITVLYLSLIIVGSAKAVVAANLREMESLLIGFYLVSFGVWTGKKTVEFVKNKSVSNVLSKFGLSTNDLAEAGETLRTKRANGSTIRVDDAEQRAVEREAAK